MDKMIDNQKKYINFLESSPIYSSIEERWKSISTESNIIKNGGVIKSYGIIIPSIMIYCDSKICKKKTIHKAIDSQGEKILSPLNLVTFRYACKHCQASMKIFNLLIIQKEGLVHITKIGEYPPFGPHIPSSASKLLSGRHRELFMKGLRSESQNLGIGAFIYYRRTLDSIKNDLIDEMIKVSKDIKAPQNYIDSLNDARQEDNFSRSVEKIKVIIPNQLKIDDENPLSLLNTALSKNIHQSSDEECLELAQAIRNILFNLLGKFDQLRKDHQELRESISLVNKLSNPQS